MFLCRNIGNDGVCVRACVRPLVRQELIDFKNRVSDSKVCFEYVTSAAEDHEGAGGQSRGQV